MAVVHDVTEADVVGDPELLYRRIRPDGVVTVEGKARLTSQAFNDRYKKPSVNRQKLRPDPVQSKQDETDGVVQLIAAEIRGVTGILHNPEAAADKQVMYKLDVLPRPIAVDNIEGLPENPAHAQIEADPNVETRTRFDKIKDALARLAERREWVIAPMPSLD